MYKGLAFFGPDELAAAFILTKHPHSPTPEELTAALVELYPNANAPTVADLLSAGLVVHSIDKKRLRIPPFSAGELQQRLESEGSAVIRPDAIHSPVIKAQRLFNYFKGGITSTNPYRVISLRQLYAVLINPPAYLRRQAEKVRAEYEANGKSERYTSLKCQLDYFTAGGTFTYRRDESLVTASGLLPLDFDNLGGKVHEVRNSLLTDSALSPALALMFTSPSGDGLKAIVASDPRYSRQTNYEYLARHLAASYGWGIKLDRQTAEISRACFLSYDPSAWLAPAYAVSTSTAGVEQ